MDIAAAQRDIATAYVGGAPAVCVSGVVWLIAGLIELVHGAEVAFAVLFVGGMLIVPTSLLIGRVLFGAGKCRQTTLLDVSVLKAQSCYSLVF
jgi:hypothetical protein